MRDSMAGVGGGRAHPHTYLAFQLDFLFILIGEPD